MVGVVEKHYFQKQVLSHVPNSVSNSIMASPKQISIGGKHPKLEVVSSSITKMPKIASEQVLGSARGCVVVGSQKQ